MVWDQQRIAKDYFVTVHWLTLFALDCFEGALDSADPTLITVLDIFSYLSQLDSDIRPQQTPESVLPAGDDQHQRSNKAVAKGGSGSVLRRLDTYRFFRRARLHHLCL